MEPKHLSYFKVENFKRFDSLEVNDIGQFNLIVGDNNVGKTSLLEALLFDDEELLKCIRNFESILINRQLNTMNADRSILDFFLKNSSFPIKYSFSYGNNKKTTHDLKINIRLRSSLNKDEIDIIGTKLLLFPENKFVEFSLNHQKSFRFFTELQNLDIYYPYITFISIYDHDLKEFFSKWAISNIWLENFKESLRAFIPRLTSVELSNAITKESLIILREEGIDIAQPLSQYGDGTIKLFRYLVEVDFCENKRLMIDEIDTGIHYSRLKDYLKMVIQTAKNKNVQIFATTHSKECIKYFGEALNELGYQNEGRVIKMADVMGGTKAYTMGFEEFSDAMFYENEIR